MRAAGRDSSSARGSSSGSTADRTGSWRSIGDRGTGSSGAVGRGPGSRDSVDRGSSDRGTADRGDASRGAGRRGAGDRDTASRGSDTRGDDRGRSGAYGGSGYRGGDQRGGYYGRGDSDRNRGGSHAGGHGGKYGDHKGGGSKYGHHKPGHGGGHGYYNKDRYGKHYGHGKGHGKGHGGYSGYYKHKYPRHGHGYRPYYRPWSFGIYLGTGFYNSYYDYPYYGYGSYYQPYSYYSSPTVYYEPQVINEQVIVEEAPREERELPIIDPLIRSPETPQNAPADAGEVERYFEAAQLAFVAGRYEESLRELQHALIDAPQDAQLYELAAQAHLALGEYDRGSSAAHQAMALSEEADWGQVVRNYERFYRGNAYVDQMKRLTDHLKEKPDDLDARFLNGYQYAFLGYNDAAIKQLDKLLAEAPQDELARQLLTRLGGTPPPLPKQVDPRDDILDPPPVPSSGSGSDVPFPLRRPS